MIEFRCECGKLLRARDEHAGQEALCPICRRTHAVPSALEAERPPLAADLGPVAPRAVEVPAEDRDAESAEAAVTPPSPLGKTRNWHPTSGAVGGLVILAGLAAAVYFGRGMTDDGPGGDVRRTLEKEWPRQHGVKSRSVDLTPLPTQHGGGKDIYTGTLTDEHGQVWDLVRVRVKERRVEWLYRPPHEQQRQQIVAEVEKQFELKVASVELTRLPHGRQSGRVTTAERVVLDVEGWEVERTPMGDFTMSPPYFAVSRESLPRYWEVKIRKVHPHLEEVELAEDGEDNWSGTARDAGGMKYTVTVKPNPDGPEGKFRQYTFEVLPAGK